MSNRTKQALVLGASGHIGNAIVRDMSANGWRVTAASRQAQRSTNLASLDIDYQVGEPASVDDYAQWFKGHDLVVDAATPYPLHVFDFSGETRTPMELAAERTRTLLAACKASGAAFACISSFTTLAEQPSNPLASLAQHPYFGVKRAIERAVMDAWERDMDVLIVNPTLCLGPWDCKSAELTMLPYLVNAEQRMTLDHMVNVIDVREVAALLRQAFDRGVFGKRLLCAGHNVAMADLARQARQLLGAEGEQRAVEGATAMGVMSALFGEALYASIGQNSPFPALALMLVQRHAAFAPGPEQTKLGVVPRPLHETVADSLSWYRQLGYC